MRKKPAGQPNVDFLSAFVGNLARRGYFPHTAAKKIKKKLEQMTKKLYTMRAV